MPELPEVETIVKDLAPWLEGRRILAARVDDPLLVRYPARQEFCHRLAGQTIATVGRRGKYIVIAMEEGLLWLVHLRMTGRLLPEIRPEECHVRARFDLAEGAVLWYCDLRRFGDMWAVRPGEEEHLGTFNHLGPEPLSDQFDGHWLAHSFAGRRAPVKALLLDQRVVAGLGNIYVDEALFAAGIHPGRVAGNLSLAQCQELAGAVKAVLQAAIAGRGTTFSDYRSGKGTPGNFQRQLQVYGRGGQQCRRCGTELVRAKVAGRGTVFCPRCQH